MSEFLDSFFKLCHNECFSRSRDMYPDLVICIKVLLSNSTTDSIALIDQLACYDRPGLMRAIYLIKVLHSHMTEENQKIWTTWLTAHKDLNATPDEKLAFFHADANPMHPTYDETAKHLGLVKGLERHRIRRLIAHVRSQTALSK
ncbi:hypothetical protein Q9L42_000275 (plasmid) [Methylomarinum sp. Ch1-1]|uniref:Uncharacterized protein n=1 Tax=Methylomarinum roseum TaxID=3067653 RepID=A0AAU7NP69_9GAMM|nr:hypothetical protein [Methylomarinum sp. Ch1-1]MDP4523077.1 hypothetical protein [Methylomarinum sp. Ch1-1]